MANRRRMATGRRLISWTTFCLAVLLPTVSSAQEATISGTVTDATGSVLPGVTVTAVHEATGNTFVGISNDRGDFNIPVRLGRIKVSAELAGFTTVSRTLELLLGQQAVLNLQMSLSAVQESVTVTGEAPLIDVTQSTASRQSGTRTSATILSPA